MAATQLDIRVFTLGEWMTNCYVVRATDAPNCWVIDCGFAPEPMIRYIREQSLTPKRVLLTHAHIDHIAGLNPLRAAFPDVPIAIHAAERAFLTDPELNLSALLPEPITAPDADATLAEGDAVDMAGLSFKVLDTPGHSPGGISLYQPEAKVVFVGDALFAGSIGRYDFPTSDPDALMRSLRDKLMALPDDTRVYPGHGPATTIGEERQNNPYLRTA